MHDTVELEALGVATAAVVTSDFVEEARSQVRALGMDELGFAVIDHPLSTLSEDEIAARAAQAVPAITAVWRQGPYEQPARGSAARTGEVE